MSPVLLWRLMEHLSERGPPARENGDPSRLATISEVPFSYELVIVIVITPRLFSLDCRWKERRFLFLIR